MIESALGRDRSRQREREGAETPAGPDARRVLQLILAAIWLLDGLLQYQSSMYSSMFGQMIGGTATGNPGVIADPITWAATLIGDHLVLVNSAFATIQLLLGLGISYRPTVRVALAASIAWSLGVWWFGEGLGAVLSGGANPVSGAPGAVILYALLAVLLWPADRPGVTTPSETAPSETAPFVAARAVGAPVARLLWLVLWGSLAYFALTPANRAPQALHDMMVGMTGGEPGWLTRLENHAAALLANQGLAASAVLAVALVVIAAGVFLPPPLARGTLILAFVVTAFIWVFGEAFGQMLTGGATDPNSGPLLALLAVAYWPRAGRVRSGPRERPAPADDVHDGGDSLPRNNASLPEGGDSLPEGGDSLPASSGALPESGGDRPEGDLA